ncbi:MAG: hypothetical protein BroJett013_19830 [Alphaproteobacteria bacterium]|nr:MAG: hypothetical protein BroJett013_19830 [Alphaproteobacteria bacterium]
MKPPSPRPLYWVVREAPRLRSFVAIEHKDGVQRVAKDGMADRSTALWVARILAKRSGGRVLTEAEMRAAAHVECWEAIGGKYHLKWDERDGEYHCWPVGPDSQLDAAAQKELASLQRSYQQLRGALKDAIVSFMIDRDGDPKPEPEALEFARIIRNERLDLDRLRALAALYDAKDVEPLLLHVVGNVGSMIGDWRELTCARNQLLLAVALVERLQRPTLTLVED